MLHSRTLSIPSQQLRASEATRNQLLSHNILQNTHDGKITFGHQTLLDILVISKSIRDGINLKTFIQELSPVPFIRPSIRSFLTILAEGDRREFRKQIRSVLTSDLSFHIRRLIAEFFAHMIPKNDDWSLIQDLYRDHREIFQVVYSQASAIDWHHFWIKYLVPLQIKQQDSTGLTTHIYRISQWKNEDPNGIISFWIASLQYEWLERSQIAEQLVYRLSDLKKEYLPLIIPLVNLILNQDDRINHQYLGTLLARCVDQGVVDDITLWHFITCKISNEDICSYNLGNKLYLNPHTFGDRDEEFIRMRMVQSSTLLDLAIQSIENWSQRQSEYFGYRASFIEQTSFADTHTRLDNRFVDAIRILFDAMEFAILKHASNHSNWWSQNCDRLCFNQEESLCYFGILALTNNPLSNPKLIGQLLCNRKILESSLAYELGLLMRSSFVYLDSQIQDTVMYTLLDLWEKETTNDYQINRLRKKVQYISTIPCFLRSTDVQEIFDAYEIENGKIIWEPEIYSSGGTVRTPFTYKVFLNTSDEGINRLLTHYKGYQYHFEDSLIGGVHEVATQLHEASSRHPLRFLNILVQFWTTIPKNFRNSIIDGVSNHLLFRFGNLQSHKDWTVVEETDPSILAVQILNELDRHPAHWHHNHSAAKALEACAHVIDNTQQATQLVFLAIGFVFLQEKPVKRSYEETEYLNQGNYKYLLIDGRHIRSGKITYALMVLANRFQEFDIQYPDLLIPALQLFSSSDEPAIRAVILSRLPNLQSKNPDLGWALLNRILQDSKGLWKYAEQCLYYAYHNHFDIVGPLLKRIPREGDKYDMKVWGRISALSIIAGHLILNDFLDDLNSLNSGEAWGGAANVWSHPNNIRQHHTICLTGIEFGLNSTHALVVAQQFSKVFHEVNQPILIPTKLLSLYFSVLEKAKKRIKRLFYNFVNWLNASLEANFEEILHATEIFMDYIHRAKSYYHDDGKQLAILMTKLFAEAEEREYSDNGELLRRVVKLQDLMLSMGIDSINDWLKAAERI